MAATSKVEPTVHTVDVFIQTSKIASQTDVEKNIWFCYNLDHTTDKNGTLTAKEVKENWSNWMSFSTTGGDTVIWKVTSVKNVRGNNFEVDTNFTIELYKVARTEPQKGNGKFIRYMGHKNNNADFYATILPVLFDQEEEYTVYFYITDTKTGTKKEFYWDPLISDKTK